MSKAYKIMLKRLNFFVLYTLHKCIYVSRKFRRKKYWRLISLIILISRPLNTIRSRTKRDLALCRNIESDLTGLYSVYRETLNHTLQGCIVYIGKH